MTTRSLNLYYDRNSTTLLEVIRVSDDKKVLRPASDELLLELCCSKGAWSPAGGEVRRACATSLKHLFDQFYSLTAPGSSGTNFHHCFERLVALVCLFDYNASSRHAKRLSESKTIILDEMREQHF